MMRKSKSPAVENIKPTPPILFKQGPLQTSKTLINRFSTNDRRRDAPQPQPQPHQKTKKRRHLRLISIGSSHYCEKVRWALDILEDQTDSSIFYTEDAHPSLFQSIATLPVSDNKISMTPMIVMDGDNGAEDEKIVLHDSQVILKELCPFLYPKKHEREIVELESYFGSHLGATIRCYMYHVLLVPEYFDVLADWLSSQSSFIESLLFRKQLKGVAVGMRKAMRITPESSRESLAILRDVFDTVSDMLMLPNGNGNGNGNGTGTKEFIMDTQNEKVGFTAADLSFCALATPLINPPELCMFQPQFDERLPQELVLLRDELRKTVAGKHVLKMYRTQRIPSATSNSAGGKHEQNVFVVPKTVNRNVGLMETAQSIVSKL